MDNLRHDDWIPLVWERVTMPKPKIFNVERLAFCRLWHTYHAKYRIPYSHEEKEEFFNSLVEIFREDKDEN